MSNRFHVATRKGLFTLERKRAWPDDPVVGCASAFCGRAISLSTQSGRGAVRMRERDEAGLTRARLHAAPRPTVGTTGRVRQEFAASAGRPARPCNILEIDVASEGRARGRVIEPPPLEP